MNYLRLSAVGAAGAIALHGFAQPVHAPSDRLREDPVAVSISSLNAARGSVVHLPLFRDTAFDFEVTQIVRRETGFTVHGKIVGESLGTCTITVENGIVSGGIWSERGIFGLTPGAPSDQSGVAISIAEQFRPETTGQCWNFNMKESLPPGVTREQLTARPHVPTGVAQTAGSSATQGTAACDCSDDQSIVDVLCVYTAKAKIAVGGLSNLQSRFQNAIDAANGAYTLSGINTGGANRLELRVAGYVETTYDEVAPDWINHLQRITTPGDGYMDEVQGLRDQYKADLVSLVVDDARFTGGAAWWALWDQGQGYSCINWRPLGGGELLLAHEIGHNFGCAHDHANDTSAPTSYAWGYNFSYNGQTYGTIMSYPGTIRLQQFSNPYMTHAPSGMPLGVNAGQPGAAFNALMIKQTRWTLASFRDAARIKDCNGNGVDDAIDIANGTSQDINGDCRPDECEERRYVDAQTPGLSDHLSWSSAAADPTEMLGMANLNCSNISQIWFANGTYKPGSSGTDRYAAFALRSGLAFYGGFQGKSRPGGGETLLSQRDPVANVSIISGEIGNQGDPTDNSYAPINAVNTNSHVVIDGFTITKGYSDWSGAGLYIENASPTVSNCIFTNNRSGYGGAVTLNGTCSPFFSNCRFESNIAVGGGGAIWVDDPSTLVVDTSTFTNNTAAWGGAIGSNNSHIDVRTSSITSNHANTYNGGAFDLNGVTLSLTNSLVAKNTSIQDGGGLWLANGTSATIINTTVANNSAATYSGGAVVYFANATIKNSILWSNTGGLAGVQDENLISYTSPVAVSYSTVQGWTGSFGGTNNNGSNPLFVSAAGGDFSLLAGSPAINSASEAALSPSFTLDLAGHVRRIGILDRGAYEFGSHLPCPADLNNDGFVEDSDFVIFAAAYNILDCADPTMPPGCPADLNGDGFVDDSDFVAFAAAYNELLCP
ncbi:MAG: M12 family metallo-peptidase [Phycisphaerales bacterium]